MGNKGAIDRLGMRGRPAGSPVMHQRWEDLLFLHWAVEPAVLRAVVPENLEIDTFDGKGWLGVTPFHLEDVRPVMLPAFPGMSSFDELNVRTYVVHEGTPGIWFFSLDASKLIAAVAARVFYMLPYHTARIVYERKGTEFDFQLRRTGQPQAQFRCKWRTGMQLRDPDVDSLGFFLVERYCAFSIVRRSLCATRIYHRPWVLEEAEVQEYASGMVSVLGMPEPMADPLVHFARVQDVEAWKPEGVGVTGQEYEKDGRAA